ncbi:hypothetical protein BS47DRAFT_1381335 [Hydnum rufescens UP504]|uniref:Uncharacterized protein n=1 Tax=Hydnum rufescens UP504 TaxID=1448309 RepID=A0A9P6B1B6_9AGAM|nr:hypothetical protein BS47DRAFT_1381335 [Hydnum rufescens UP504]
MDFEQISEAPFNRKATRRPTGLLMDRVDQVRSIDTSNTLIRLSGPRLVPSVKEVTAKKVISSSRLHRKRRFWTHPFFSDPASVTTIQLWLMLRNCCIVPVPFMGRPNTRHSGSGSSTSLTHGRTMSLDLRAFFTADTGARHMQISENASTDDGVTITIAAQWKEYTAMLTVIPDSPKRRHGGEVGWDWAC